MLEIQPDMEVVDEMHSGHKVIDKLKHFTLILSFWRRRFLG